MFRPPPRLSWQFSVAGASLSLLVLQNSALILTMHYSRISPAGTGPRYLASTALLLVEVIKLLVSFSIETYQISKENPDSRASGLAGSLGNSLFSADSWKLIIPAALYTLQNSLVYVAISNLQVVTFQVTYQLKILTTALFSMLMLGKVISSRQWASLVLLAFGVSVVQNSEFPGDEIKRRLLSLLLSSTDASRRSFPSTAPPTNPSAVHMNQSTGILAVVAASLISGLTCVYFEKILKTSSVSLWTRNVQLSFFSIFPALAIGVLWQDGETISRQGFFAGYNPVVWATITLQALGGMLVAVCITYSDNIAKNLAASFSIVVSGAASSFMFHAPITFNTIVGSTAVLMAMYLYQSQTRPSPLEVLPLHKMVDRRN